MKWIVLICVLAGCGRMPDLTGFPIPIPIPPSGNTKVIPVNQKELPAGISVCPHPTMPVGIKSFSPFVMVCAELELAN